MKHPYAVPSRLSPDLARAQAYWKGLLRGAATVPFWDDARPSDLPGLEGRLLLIDVFERPERFRFNSVGSALTRDELSGLFLDELRLSAPFEFLRSQCDATVEAAAPTYYRSETGAPAPSDGGYARLLLPMWGQGHIGLLLGVVDFD